MDDFDMVTAGDIGFSSSDLSIHLSMEQLERALYYNDEYGEHREKKAKKKKNRSKTKATSKRG
jgi:hypothetical protein